MPTEKRGSVEGKRRRFFFPPRTVNDFTLVWAALGAFSWTRQQYKAVTSHWFHLSHHQFAASLVVGFFHLHVSVEMFRLNQLTFYKHFLPDSRKKQQYVTRGESTFELARFLTCQQCDFNYYDCLASVLLQNVNAAGTREDENTSKYSEESFPKKTIKINHIRCLRGKSNEYPIMLQ